jgi:hypothetical protein
MMLQVPWIGSGFISRPGTTLLSRSPTLALPLVSIALSKARMRLHSPAHLPASFFGLGQRSRAHPLMGGGLRTASHIPYPDTPSSDGGESHCVGKYPLSGR